jgi:hypothetical protein
MRGYFCKVFSGCAVRFFLTMVTMYTPVWESTWHQCAHSDIGQRLWWRLQCFLLPSVVDDGPFDAIGSAPRFLSSFNQPPTNCGYGHRACPSLYIVRALRFLLSFLLSFFLSQPCGGCAPCALSTHIVGHLMRSVKSVAPVGEASTCVNVLRGTQYAGGIHFGV